MNSLAITTLHFVKTGQVIENVKMLAHNGVAAAAEFQKVPDRFRHEFCYGITSASPNRTHLRHLRQYQMTMEYQEFLALWKDADPEIPILKQAKAEYAKLK